MKKFVDSWGTLIFLAALLDTICLLSPAHLRFFAILFLLPFSQRFLLSRRVVVNFDTIAIYAPILLNYLGVTEGRTALSLGNMLSLVWKIFRSLSWTVFAPVTGDRDAQTIAICVIVKLHFSDLYFYILRRKMTSMQISVTFPSQLTYWLNATRSLGRSLICHTR